VSLFPVFPPEEDTTHIASYMARSIESAGLLMNAGCVFEDAFKTAFMAPETPIAEELGPVVIHPGSGSRKKNYPPAFWLELIKGIKSEQLDNSQKIIMLLGPAEEDIIKFFRDNLNDGDVELKVLPSTEELTSILGRASVYIGHDSGVTHLAAMLGIHVIALFKDSRIDQWRPLGPNVRIIANGN
ncbi:MAG: glycosyltransferase family 9 protein, partial [Methanothrix sp.]|nr:glycosyltransferase family 9 protein [Methanothrix sp.]